MYNSCHYILSKLKRTIHLLNHHFSPFVFPSSHFPQKTTISGFSSPKMASLASRFSFSYQKLRNEGGDDEERILEGARTRSSSYRMKRVSLKRRFRVKIPALRRFLRGRLKIKMVSSVKCSFWRVMKRLRESQEHFGDIFAGNYLFMQVNPSSGKQIHKYYHGISASPGFNRFPPAYSLPKISA